MLYHVDGRLHQQLSYYFRSSLFQPVCNCRHQNTILDGYVQLLTVTYKSRNLWINLESYPKFQQLRKIVFYIHLILSFYYS